MRSKHFLATVFDAEGWRAAGRDVASGLVESARLFFTSIGVIALAAAAALVCLPTTRALAGRLLPAADAQPIAALRAPATEPQPAAADDADDDDLDQVQLDPGLTHAAAYLARRYRVADEAVREMVAAAKVAGEENHVDPLLVLAVVAVESGMNPVAQSPMGARGLMQVMTSVHADLLEEQGGDQAALEPVANIKVGTAILSDLIRRGGSVDRGLQLYVGAGLNGDGGGYAARVRNELQHLRVAASGRVDAALAAAMRQDAHATVTTEPAPASHSPSAAEKS